MTSLQVSSISNKYVKSVLAKKSFWHFCNIISPDFYKEERPHLRKLCNKLHDLYTEKLIKKDGTPYKKLIIQMPPRHGKSRTLTNFSAWILGLNNENRIVTASYNDDLAQDFSRHTRDIISEQRTQEEDILYSDIFPDTQIKQGDASYKKWALEGQFFNYKGTGIGGSVTGRGGNILIVDDPIKDAEVAYNELALDKIWLWYTGTFLSRAEEGAIQIFCMTPWAKKDPVSRLLEQEPDEWYIMTMPVMTDGEMLCDDLFSEKTFYERKKIADENIFSANYLMKRLDIKGRLYSGFKTYSELPSENEITARIGYVDTADEGKDFLAAFLAVKSGPNLYVTNILYTQDPQEKTEPALVQLIGSEKTRQVDIESNNGGRAFARNIIRMLREKGIRSHITWFHQSKNKKARILTNAPLCQEYILFPEDWNIKWAMVYNALMNYQKEGKNKHDDAPDALTGLVEKFLNRKMSVPSMPIPGI